MINTDILIIGAGAAGMTAAIELSNQFKVTLITKNSLIDSSTWYAQGGIAAVIDGNDSIEDHLRDTLIAGDGLCDEDMLDKSVPYAKLYAQAVRLFKTKKPVIAIVQGAAIGGGLGLALSADFRIACPEARFAANFAKLGFHPGFGSSVTLPRIVGTQNAADMLYTARRVGGEEALGMGLADKLTSKENLISESEKFASEIASSAPMAIESIRSTLRGNLAQQVEEIVDWELSEQVRLQKTDDFKAGIAASLTREIPKFSRK